MSESRTLTESWVHEDGTTALRVGQSGATQMNVASWSIVMDFCNPGTRSGPPMALGRTTVIGRSGRPRAILQSGPPRADCLPRTVVARLAV